MSVFTKPRNHNVKRFPMLLLICLAIISGLLLESQTSAETPLTATLNNPSVVQNTVATQFSTAQEALNELPIKGRAPKTGYTRDQFGAGWANGGGCDTRNRILTRDLKNVLYDVNSCIVVSGILNDPYTGREIVFERGSGTSTAVQIDHVVALSDAWQKGAQQLTPELRIQFANDGLNLLAVDGPSNMVKGDGDAATWLPPNKAVRCGYVARQISVKLKYSLWVTAAEKDAMLRVLKDCPGQALDAS